MKDRVSRNENKRKKRIKIDIFNFPTYITIIDIKELTQWFNTK